MNPSYTVNEFCAAEKISRSQLYEDWANGRGPRYYRNGRHRRITDKARRDWQRQREREAEAEAEAKNSKKEKERVAA